ncbi:RNA polymerase sigma factor SigM [Nocardioides insulae]|uniref:RNA polymerase sigma factor SigM n=1 Tax=Nocardioides insulae TaxID=394734 RepID=UPI0004114B38|nr:RNA polymerase sigma factor SigM [Nocardioides insulae]
MTARSEEPDDKELLAAHVAGDRDAFGVLVARHRNRLWAVALRTLGNPEDAADGLQDGLIAAFRRAGTYRGESAVTTWLHRVVVNACLDRARAAGVRRTEPLPEDPDRPGSYGRPSPVTEQDSPQAHAEMVERRTRVLTALEQLPVDQRAALVLVDMEGYSVAETAAILDCAEGTVKSRCARGRRRLADLLADLLVGTAPGAPDAARNPPAPRRVPPTDPARGPPPTG